MAARRPLVLAAGLLRDEAASRPVADRLADLAEVVIASFAGWERW